MKLLDWYRALTQREQVYLLVAAVCIGLYVLLMGIWQPLSGARDDMARRNQLVSEQLGRVRMLAGELRQLEASGGNRNARNINQLINSSTSEFGIRPTRIQPNSRGETQVRFENVGFADLLRWLHQLESVDGMAVREVAINQGDSGGIVKATVRLGQGA